MGHLMNTIDVSKMIRTLITTSSTSSPPPPPSTPRPSQSTTNQSASTSNTDSTSPILHPFVTQKLVDTARYYCPFLERGFCREQSRCNFSHDCQQSTKIPIDFCHFYLANKCLYGQDCKFVHAEPITDHADNELSHLAYINLTDNNHDGYNGCQAYDRSLPSNDDFVDHRDPSQHHHSPGDHRVSTSLNLSSSITISTSQTSEANTLASSSSTNDNNDGSYTTGLSIASSTSIVTASCYGAAKSANSSATIADNKSSANADCARLLASLQSQSSSCSNENNQGAQVYTSQQPSAYISTRGCPFAYGTEICDLCCMPCLDPYNEEQRRQHRDECLREHEREMELSFAVQRSKDKICGICMDTVIEKEPITSSRFGILEKCNHIFCLNCIRKWRRTKQFESKTIRACPECRVNSDFVVPSKYWIEEGDDKEILIRAYKAALSSIPCKYFKEGFGSCPFGKKCFYKHAYPDGTLAQMDSPRPKRRSYGARRSASLTNYVLWSLIRSFNDDDWSNDDEDSDSPYIEDEFDEEDYADENDGDDDDANDEEQEDDDEALAATIAELTAPVW